MGEAAPGGRDRSAQKRRTRRAILTAALDIMQRGATPSSQSASPSRVRGIPEFTFIGKRRIR